MDSKDEGTEMTLSTVRMATLGVGRGCKGEKVGKVTTGHLFSFHLTSQSKGLKFSMLFLLVRHEAR